MDNILNTFSFGGWGVIIMWIFMIGFVSGAKNDIYGGHRVAGFCFGLACFVGVMIYFISATNTGNAGLITADQNGRSLTVEQNFSAARLAIATGCGGVVMYLTYIFGVSRSR